MAEKKGGKIKIYTIAATLLILYLTVPVIAGMLKIGDMEGPRVYPAKLHEALYKMGYGAAGHGTAPTPVIDNMLYERPLFYGMKRKLIPQTKAEELLDKTKHWLHND